MLQEFVDKLNDRYPDPGNCGIIALALVSGSHYLQCKKIGMRHGWKADGITCQGLMMALKDLEVKFDLYDGERKRLKTWGRMSGIWIAKTRDHFAIIMDGELINPAGCENHEVKMLLKIYE